MTPDQLCRVLITDTNIARQVSRQIHKAIQKKPKKITLQGIEDTWRLRTSTQVLLPWLKKQPPRPSGQEGVTSLKAVFERLEGEEQLLLLLKADPALTWDMLAVVFQAPIDSIRFRHRMIVYSLSDRMLEPLDRCDHRFESVSNCARCKTWDALCGRVEEWLRTEVSEVDPQQAPGRKSKMAIQRTKQWWHVAPWFVRTSIEGAVVSLAIMVAVAFVPKIRSFYEKTMTHRLESFDFVEPNISVPNEAVNMAEGEDESEESDTHALELEPTGQTIDDKDVTVSENEVWRLNIKTDSPREVRVKIEQALARFAIAQDSPESKGVQAPGGVQYILAFPIDKVIPFKNEVRSLSLVGESGTSFTWFKNKSRKKIPPGSTSVIVWVYQI